MDNYVNEIISLDKNRRLTLTQKFGLCSQIGDIIILTPLLSMRETFPGRKKEDGGGGGVTSDEEGKFGKGMSMKFSRERRRVVGEIIGDFAKGVVIVGELGEGGGGEN